MHRAGLEPESDNFLPSILNLARRARRPFQACAVRMREKATDFYESETDHNVATLTTLFEPLIIVFLGVSIAFILIAMYLPLFDLMKAV